MYKWSEFFKTERKPYTRWKSDDLSFSRPNYGIPRPLEQCQFVMNQMTKNNQVIPVGMWGEAIDLDKHNTLNFNLTRQFWIEGHGEYFDGYSLVLPETPSPLKFNDQQLYLVVGIHENCVSQKDSFYHFSNDFLATWLSLGEPIIWFTPSRTGICWAGLHPMPITGGKTEFLHITSVDIALPITNFFEPDDETLKILPNNADITIGRILKSKEAK